MKTMSRLLAATMFVAGSAIFGQPDYHAVIGQMRAELARVGSWEA